MNNTQSSPRSNIIIAIMLSALTYWLFAQSFINIRTSRWSKSRLKLLLHVADLSISLTSFATRYLHGGCR